MIPTVSALKAIPIPGEMGKRLISGYCPAKTDGSMVKHSPNITIEAKRVHISRILGQRQELIISIVATTGINIIIIG